MNTIITIGREFGSLGREIGEKLAAKFDIPCYDKELLKRAASESGLCTELFENHDERPTSSFLYNLVMDTYSFGYSNSTYVDMPIGHKVFLAQFDAIKKIATEGPCIIIGRCADYALADLDNCIHIFIHADLETRIQNVLGKYSDLNYDKAKDMIAKKDKQRANYYNYFSSKKWGVSNSYDLSIDSGVLGVDGTVQMLYEFVKAFDEKGQDK